MSPPAEANSAPDHRQDCVELPATEINLIEILSAVEETAYIWDFATDRIDWESNAAKVLGVSDLHSISTGEGFRTLVASEHAHLRNLATGSARTVTGKAVPYRVQYRFMPQGQRRDFSIWLEDHGTLVDQRPRQAGPRPRRGQGDQRPPTRTSSACYSAASTTS